MHSPQTIAWYSVAVIATVNLTVQLDYQEFKLSANIRYAEGPWFEPRLGRGEGRKLYCYTYNLMLIALAYVSSTIPRVEHQSVEILKTIETLPDSLISHAVIQVSLWIQCWQCTRLTLGRTH